MFIRVLMWIPLLSLCGVASSAPATRAAPPLRYQTLTFAGWKGCVALTAGPYRLVVAPSIGGRIIDYSRNGVGPIWINPAERGRVRPLDPKAWHNYGGYKTWPAPQSKWGWPPDPLLDAAPANVTPWRENGRLVGLRIEGKASPAAGIAFIKHVRMDPATGRVRLVQTMRALPNAAQPSVRWGVWDITQVAAEGIVATPLNPRSRHRGGVYFYSPEARKSRQWKVQDGLLLIRNRNEVAKYGADTNGGWMAWLRGRQAYVKRFPPMARGEEYPDEYSTAQIYTNSAALPYTEMEVAGPIKTLKPGQSTTLEEEWRLLPLPMTVRTEEDAVRAIRVLKRRGHLKPLISGR